MSLSLTSKAPYFDLDLHASHLKLYKLNTWIRPHKNINIKYDTYLVSCLNIYWAYAHSETFS